jgi:putative membrane protein
MGGGSFFSKSFREAVKSAVGALEKDTRAEVVVAVRPCSASYRHTDLAVGAFVALLVLCVFLYHPRPFDFTFLPLELLASFAFGAVVTASVPALRRALTSRRLMRQSAELAARAAFVDLGVHRTKGRSGVLVFVAAFERRVVVLTDMGVPTEAMGEGWKDCCARLEARARKGPTELVAALVELGPLLAKALPRMADDENELADGVAEVAS